MYILILKYFIMVSSIFLLAAGAVAVIGAICLMADPIGMAGLFGITQLLAWICVLMAGIFGIMKK